jgi:hypothetical protein
MHPPGAETDVAAEVAGAEVVIVAAEEAVEAEVEAAMEGAASVSRRLYNHLQVGAGGRALADT